MNRTRINPFRLTEQAAIVSLGAVPGLCLAGVLGGGRVVIIAVAASMVAALSVSPVDAVLTRRGSIGRRRHAVAMTGAMAIVLGLLVIVVAAALPGPRYARRSPFVAVAEAVIHGWAAWATSPVPADHSPRLLVPLVVLVFVATVGAIALQRWSQSLLAPLAPVLVAFVIASVAAGATQFRPAVVGLGVLVACASFVWARQAHHQPNAIAAERAPRVDRVDMLRAGGLVIVASLASVMVGPNILGDRAQHPFDPRDHVASPTIPTSPLNPVEFVALSRLHPDRPMFSVEGSEPQFTRLVALETFDGASWSTTASFRPTGTFITPPNRLLVSHQQTHATVVVSEMPGPWLPTLANPEMVAGVNARLDAASGSLVSTSGTLKNVRYTLTADATTPLEGALRSAQVAPDAPQALQLPVGLPDEFTKPLNNALSAIDPNASPYEKATALAAYLKTNFAIDDSSGIGQSYAHLTRVLIGARAGTQEQLAEAFAVLGRLAGLPTRLVVGFAPGLPSGSPNTFDVVYGDARVWPEVKFDKVGWVAFDPVPVGGGNANPDDSSLEGLGKSLQANDQLVVPTTIIPSTVPTIAATPTTSANGDRWILGAIIGFTAGLVLLFLAAVGVIVVKHIRTRRRRRRGTATERVLGAWHDVMDRMVEVGVAQPATCTVEELVEHNEHGSTSLAALYRPVNRALYGQQELAEHDVEQAWKARDRFVRSVHRNASLGARVGILVNPRPMWRGPSQRSDRRVHTSKERST